MSQEGHNFDSDIEEEVENEEEECEVPVQPQHRRIITQNLDDKDRADIAGQPIVPPQPILNHSSIPIIGNNPSLSIFNLANFLPELGLNDLMASSSRQFLPFLTFPIGLMAMPNAAQISQQGYNMFINFNQNLLSQNSSPSFGRFNIQQTMTLNQQIKKKYYQLRTTQIDSRRDQVDLSQPHLKVTFVKQQEYNNDQSYIITEFGLQQSQKNTNVEDIMIGRQHIFNETDQQIFPNDIVLPISDRAISRVHCKLIIKDGFIKKNYCIQRDFFIFLQFQQQNKKKLPINIQKIIQEFLKQTPLFYLQDLGSVQGTYLKVRNNKEQLIEKGNTYFIGADTQFHIIDCQVGKPEKITQEQLEANFIEAQQNSKVHGYITDEQIQIKFRAQRTFRPMIKIQFSNLAPQMQTYQIFYAKVNEFDELQMTIYRFGRNQDSDMTINFNTISRKQCKIRYCPLANNWFISDGDQSRESANGTWLSLTDFHEKYVNSNQKEESKKKLIDNGTEIKISESILKVEMINFDQRKSQYTFEQRKRNSWSLLSD